MSLDLLVLAPHPDDGELGCGGLLARAKAEGLMTGILDLTRGEQGSKGTPEQRAQEVERASQILGLAYRGNLGFPDGGLADLAEQRQPLAEALRELRPAVVLIPWEADRHPDHRAAFALGRSAVHLAALRNAPVAGAPHRVKRLLCYPGNDPVLPHLVVDISSFIELWEAAVRSYESQFSGPAVSETVGPAGVEGRKALRRYWGQVSGVDYAEPLVSLLPLLGVPWF